MNRFRYFYFTVILIVLACFFCGCNSIQAVSSEIPSVTSPEQTTLPATESPAVSPSESPSETPTYSPRKNPIGELVLPDYDVQTSILFDINGDGAKDTISIGLGNESENGNDILLSVSDNGVFNTITVGSGYFEAADYLYTPGGTFCVALSYSPEDQYSLACLISFDGLKPVLHASVDGSAFYFYSTGFAVNSWIDALGTWQTVGYYNVTDDFKLESALDPYIHTGQEPLVTKRPIKAEVWKEGEYIKVTLEAGTSLDLYQTDGKTYMTFSLKDYFEDGSSAEGTLYFTKKGNECFIDGVSEYDCFVNVPYAN